MAGFLSFLLWLQHNSVVLMFSVFVMILVTAYWPGRQPTFDRDARIPLDDDR